MPPYVGMGNDPVSGVDPDGGYSYLGAKWRQAAAFFKGQNPSNIMKSGGEFGFNTRAEGQQGFTAHYGPNRAGEALANQINIYYQRGQFNPRTGYTEGSGAVEANYIEFDAALAYFTWGAGNEFEVAAKGVRLSDDVAKTFQFGKYTEMTLDEPMVLSRYYDNVNAFAKGRFMTNSTSSSTFLDRMGLALKPSWNGMTKVADWEIPAGTTIYRGRAAMQFPWLGGKTQYFVPELGNVKRVIR